MDADTKDRFAIRCIVVSTQSGMANIARTPGHDRETRDRLQAAALQRGNLLLTELEHEHVLSSTSRRAMRSARVALAD